MKITVIITWVCLFLSGCGSTHLSVVSDDPIQQLETQRIFAIRLNACGCIIDTPELDFEVKLGQRWKRVFLQADDATMPAFQRFRSERLRHPRSVTQIEDEFTGVFYQWVQGHQAPGLQFMRAVDDTLDDGDKNNP